MHSVSGAGAVAKAVQFHLTAPATLAGRARTEVRSLGDGALIVYGKGLDSVLVYEKRAGGQGGVALPVMSPVSVNGAAGHELETTLGSVVQFSKRPGHLHGRRVPDGRHDPQRSTVAALSAAAAAGALVEIDGVSKRYGDVVALDDVSASVTERAVGLLGANGAGKSTLMRSMLGLIRPDEGSISVMGMGIEHAWDIRRRLGYMPEHSSLPMGMTARDLVVHMGELRGLPRRVAVLRASEVLFQVGLEEERSRLIRTFSVGMRQRTNLAQAIVHSPAMVILDEPTNGLDPAGREEMLTLVRRLSADLGIAVIMSSHVLEDVVRTCDSVLVLRDGKIVATQRLAQADRVDNGEVQVQIVGDADAFATAAAALGLAVRPDGEWLLVRGDDADAVLRGVRDAAIASGAGLHELRPAGPTIEQSLIGAIG